MKFCFFVKVDKPLFINNISHKLVIVKIRKKFSTSYAIISLIENIQKGVDDKQIACGVFIDLGKAFGTVDHTLLLNKLSYYGN